MSATTRSERAISDDGLSVCTRNLYPLVWYCSRFGDHCCWAAYADHGEDAADILDRFELARASDPQSLPRDPLDLALLMRGGGERQDAR